MRSPTALPIAGIRAYQRWVSPMLPQRCRFAPTCSEYAVEALIRHGSMRGAWLAVRRVLRCHPFHSGGYDPVPGTPAVAADLPTNDAVQAGAPR